MNPVNVISHSPLTQNDITRMPSNAVALQAPVQNPGNDAYVPTQEKKMGGFTKLLIGLGIAAAAMVGVHKFFPNLLKVTDAANPSMMDKVRKGVEWCALKIEAPFAKGWELLKSGFSWIKSKFTKAA